MSLDSAESAVWLATKKQWCASLERRYFLTLRDYETAALWFRASLNLGEQERAVARLWVNLQGLSKEVVRMCKPQDFEGARKVERLLRIFRESPLASMLVPDAYKKIQAYDQIRRRPGEVIGDNIAREERAFREMTEALRCVRNSRDEESGVRRHDHRATSGNSSVCSEAEFETVEDEDTFIEAPWRQEQTGRTFFELEIRGYRLLQNACLSRQERQMVLAGTRNVHGAHQQSWHSCVVLGMTKTSVNETQEGRPLKRTARFILQKPTLNGMLNKLRTASWVMHLSWR